MRQNNAKSKKQFKVALILQQFANLSKAVVSILQARCRQEMYSANNEIIQLQCFQPLLINMPPF